MPKFLCFYALSLDLQNLSWAHSSCVRIALFVVLNGAELSSPGVGAGEEVGLLEKG